MSILPQNRVIVKVSFTNQDFSAKTDGQTVVNTTTDTYIFDRSLYGSDSSFLNSVKNYIRAQYTAGNILVWQMEILSTGTLITFNSPL